MTRIHMGNGVSNTSRKRAFTLIELLVVVAIIAMLVSMLMPSLNRAKDLARAAVCSSNIKGIGSQLSLYTTEWGSYPPSYTYPAKDGTYNFYSTQDQTPDGQMTTSAYGYQHWSWYIAGKTKLGDKFFSCPIMKNGGIARTNPGTGPSEAGQQVQNIGVEDRQAPRMAYTANGAIMTRNKFTLALAVADGYSDAARTNQFVSPEAVANASGVILMTEFMDNWNVIVKQGSKIVKSHRPITVFGNIGYGDDYSAPTSTPCFMYGTNPTPAQKPDYNLKPYAAMMGAAPAEIIDCAPGHEVNSVGRHHPGGDNKYGGTANFLYVDGHVARKTILETLKDREWGHRYYGITGKNKVYEDDWSTDMDN